MAPIRQDTCKVCGAPRAEGSTVVLCAEHLREYNSAAMRRTREAGHGTLTPEHQRLNYYRRAAVRLGANDLEAAWIALAAEIEHDAGRMKPRALDPLIAAELAWLRANADVLARLDERQWQPVKGDTVPVIDDGWDELDEAS